MEIETVVITTFMDPIATIREVLFLNGRFPLDFVFLKKNKKNILHAFDRENIEYPIWLHLENRHDCDKRIILFSFSINKFMQFYSAFRLFSMKETAVKVCCAAPRLFGFDWLASYRLFGFIQI